MTNRARSFPITLLLAAAVAIAAATLAFNAQSGKRAAAEATTSYIVQADTALLAREAVYAMPSAAGLQASSVSFARRLSC